jgi:hypothetical protein
VARLFFSYAHVDPGFRDGLERGLAMVKREGLIEAWHDRLIPAGAHVDHTISHHLDAADVILLLVSPDFLASHYCYDVEVQRALARHDAREATVIPMIVRPCEWQRALFGRLNALPTGGKLVGRWTDLAKRTSTLSVAPACPGGRDATASFAGTPPTSPVSAQLVSPPTTVARAPDLRSNNLRATRT